MGVSPRRGVGVLVAAAVLLVTAGGGSASAAPALPVVTPTPQHIAANGPALVVPGAPTVLVGAGVDQPTKDAIAATLTGAGATRIRFAPLGSRPGRELTVLVGAVTDPTVADALRATGGQVPATLPAEGYSLASGPTPAGPRVVLAGNDPDGVFYAAQTLRQITAKHRVASVTVTDHPAMALRGTIEGFYGAPWSQADRLDQLATYGRLKMNTYIYTPKDDAYLRDRWRDPYPAAELAQLRELVAAAERNHVRFTFAVAPGLSICYSDPADLAALEAKFASVYAFGVRSFYISLDDISYKSWNCAGDEAAFGAPSAGAAGAAQTFLLNHVQRDYLDDNPGTRLLQFVSTEYYDTADSPYKTALRTGLDPRIVVQWTGPDTVPPAVTVAQAKEADAVWGRRAFLWDNYPVNDYGQAAGRLLLAPYDAREPGLSAELAGIVVNPMNQASASTVAEFGAASFTWNDGDYDPQRTWVQAAGYLAGDDPATTDALLTFFDTQHLAPTFGDTPWQPQAPMLAARIAEFDTAWATGSRGERSRALVELDGTARQLAGATARIRAHVVDPAFLTETAPWLDALQLWGQAFQRTVDGLRQRQAGAEAAATMSFADSAALAGRAAAIRTIPGTTRPQGPVKVADGVLDTFLAAAPTRP